MRQKWARAYAPGWVGFPNKAAWWFPKLVAGLAATEARVVAPPPRSAKCERALQQAVLQHRRLPPMGLPFTDLEHV